MWHVVTSFPGRGDQPDAHYYFRSVEHVKESVRITWSRRPDKPEEGVGLVGENGLTWDLYWTENGNIVVKARRVHDTIIEEGPTHL